MAFPTWRKSICRRKHNTARRRCCSWPDKAFTPHRQVRHYCSRLETMLDMLLDCFSMVMPVCISTCCLVMLDASVA